MPIATREQLAGLKRRERIVDAPELGEGMQVIVAELSGLDAVDFQASYAAYSALPEDARTQREQLAMMADVVDRTVLGEDREPLFSEGFLAFARQLNITDTLALAGRCFGAAMELSGFADDESAEGNGISRSGGASRAA